MFTKDLLTFCVHLSEKVIFGNGDVFHTVSSLFNGFSRCLSDNSANKKSKPMVHAQALRFHICLYRKLIGESCSAFCTSSLQNFATVGGTHSFSEAVFFLSLKLLGLVCSKHLFAPP
jgi:hypothetical protein